jgi:hypothetical protein
MYHRILFVLTLLSFSTFSAKNLFCGNPSVWAVYLEKVFFVWSKLNFIKIMAVFTISLSAGLFSDCPTYNSFSFLIAFISGWVKRTIDPVLPPPAPSVTMPAAADTDSLGVAITSSLKIESDPAAPLKDTVSPGIRGTSEAGAV